MQTRSQFEDLPIDLFEDIQSVILTSTRARTLSALAGISRTMCSFFQPYVDQEGMKLLFQYVKSANYAGAERIVRAHPALIFMTIKDEPLSPFQLSIQLRDTFMYRMFYKAIKGNLEQERQMYIQAKKVEGYLSLEPLKQAYDEFSIKLNLYFNDRISAPKLVSYWHKIGKAQQQCLPWHMVYEFHRIVHLPTFAKDPTNPVLFMKYDAPPNTPSKMILYWNEDKPGFYGTGKTLVSVIDEERRIQKIKFADEPSNELIPGLKRDLRFLQALHQKRQEELQTFLKELYNFSIEAKCTIS